MYYPCAVLPEPARPAFESRVGPCDFVVQVEPGRFLRADSLGRWITLHDGQGFLHRTLDGRVVRRGRQGASDLDPGAASLAHLRAISLAREFAELLCALPDREIHVGGDREALLHCLAAVGPWTPERHMEESDRYLRAYPEPVTILPPDRYRDVVVLPATGCAHGACTFCTLHRDRPFLPLADSDFDAHLDAVRDLLGPMLAQRDGVFLGSASALTLPDRSLLARMGQVERLLGRRRRGVASFLDPDRSPRRAVADWRALASAGLVLAVMGLETGDAELRSLLGKRGGIDRLASIAADLAVAGIRRGVTILVGAGGKERREAHLEGTAAAIAALDLSPQDVVYLSPLSGSMPAVALEAETSRMRQVLRATTRAKVVPYRLDLFRYYA